MRLHGRIAGLVAMSVLGAGCAAPPRAQSVPVSVWGTMREVLREGHSDARVRVTDVVRPTSIAVGALAGLAGEITVIDGRTLVAVPGPVRAGATSPAECAVRDATAADGAALLVLAEVERWESVPIGSCASYADLERKVSLELERRGIEPSAPTPIRVRGRALELSLHVIAGNCPIANPAGAAPWRWSGAAARAELVGFFAADAAGRLTHHDRTSHLHALVEGITGHLDDVVLADAELLVPAR